MDLDKKLVFPPEIVATTLRPDMVLWSPTTKLAYVVELTVPWEDGVEEAYESKKNKYSDLAAEASQNGWKTSIFTVDVGCMGICCNIYHQFAEKNRGERSLSPAGHQVHIKCC